MIEGAEELQKAVFARLAADASLGAMLAGDGIYDIAPASAPFPYITFGRTTIFDWSTATDLGREELLTVHVWSQAKGRKQTLSIMNTIAALLAEFQPALSSVHLVSFRLEYSEARFEEDVLLHHGLMRYRSLIEIAASSA